MMLHVGDPRTPGSLTTPLSADPAVVRQTLEFRFGESELAALRADATVVATCGTSDAEGYWHRLAGLLERLPTHADRAPVVGYETFVPVDARDRANLSVFGAVGVSTTGHAGVLAGPAPDAVRLFVRNVSAPSSHWSRHRTVKALRALPRACDVTGQYATMLFAEHALVVDMSSIRGAVATIALAAPTVHMACNGTLAVGVEASGALRFYDLATLTAGQPLMPMLAPPADEPAVVGTHPLTGEPLHADPEEPEVVQHHACRVAFNQLAPTHTLAVSLREGFVITMDIAKQTVGAYFEMSPRPTPGMAPTRWPLREPADALVLRRAPDAADCTVAVAARHLALLCAGPLEAQIVARGVAPRSPALWSPDHDPGLVSLAVFGTTLVAHRLDNSVHIGTTVPNPLSPGGDPFRFVVRHTAQHAIAAAVEPYSSLFVDSQRLCCLFPNGLLMTSRPQGAPARVETDTPAGV
jgi:hypothetical protein